ncbi:Trk-type K+ transport system, membrane component [Halobacteroides halobius DSM 5150]|uniref:Trk-type K+ transport system, membrane component n=1 Tax=Halobacteroides halobius (strain ATCC 35273 / DSM 5150 / MD-1) TaxID=748449 RepID=L0KA09_HALHC|nr:TrkH family potassium uptake protein [Halobacteroides halobius]AGB41831.1 Trk-type K+ transport system, membrane component [Halobacteroides halobius DSM 5150]
MFNQKLTTVISLIGSLLIVLGCTLLLPIVVGFIYGEELVYAFIIPALLSLGLGFITQFKFKKGKINLTTGMLVCALGWITISFVGALPFYLKLDYTYLDTLFETVSGFTTTGITVFTDLSNLPKSIQFWRCLIQWLGGLGFLTFFLVVTFRGQAGLFQLFTAESHKINQSRPVPNIFKTVKILWGIYALFTLLEIILLKILGVSLFDAITHSFTTLSTGGFTNYDASIAYFKQTGYQYYKLIEYVTILFMTLGGINFLVHYKVLTGEINALWDKIEMKYFWAIISGVSSLIILDHYLAFPFKWSGLERTIRYTLFQVVSILTTTGFATEGIITSFYPALAKQFFLLLMFIGGCVGSTAGGIKIIRVAILNKLLQREVKKIYYPKHAVLPVVVDGNKISDQEIFKTVALVFGWLILIVIGGAITAISSNLSAWQAFSGIFSALGNIGPFYFSVEKMQSLSAGIKITYIIGMLAGRLEILPIFVLFSKQAWRR